MISGLRVFWDSSKPLGDRVKEVWLLSNEDMDDAADRYYASDEDKGPLRGGTLILNERDTEDTLKEKALKNEEPLRTYKIATLLYMLNGGGGYGDILKRGRVLVPEESGKQMSYILERYLNCELTLHRYTYNLSITNFTYLREPRDGK